MGQSVLRADFWVCAGFCVCIVGCAACACGCVVRVCVDDDGDWIVCWLDSDYVCFYFVCVYFSIWHVTDRPISESPPSRGPKFRFFVWCLRDICFVLVVPSWDLLEDSWRSPHVALPVETFANLDVGDHPHNTRTFWNTSHDTVVHHDEMDSVSVERSAKIAGIRTEVVQGHQIENSNDFGLHSIFLHYFQRLKKKLNVFWRVQTRELYRTPVRRRGTRHITCSNTQIDLSRVFWMIMLLMSEDLHSNTDRVSRVQSRWGLSKKQFESVRPEKRVFSRTNGNGVRWVSVLSFETDVDVRAIFFLWILLMISPSDFLDGARKSGA